jgi:hypothetical protein
MLEERYIISPAEQVNTLDEASVFPWLNFSNKFIHFTNYKDAHSLSCEKI